MGTRIASHLKSSEDERPLLNPNCETFESQELFRRAEVCIQRRNIEKAEALLADALKISPENPRYLSYYGLCVGMLGELGEAEKICLRAVKLYAYDPIILVNLGRILLEQGKRREAREMFARAYEMDNRNSAAALELSGMGVRRPPVIPFLTRNNPLNVALGRLRHRLLGYKKIGWKKL
jgi:Flp pilus assembly protein TadD